MQPIVRCKAIGHSWEEFFPIDATRPPWGYSIYLRCVNGCGKTRRDVIDMHGNLSYRTYWQDTEIDYNGVSVPDVGDTWKSGWRVVYVTSTGAEKKRRSQYDVDKSYPKK